MTAAITKNQVKRREVISTMRDLIPKGQRTAYSIKDLKKGSFLAIGKKSYLVEGVGVYTEVKWKDFSPKKSDYVVTELELFCITTGETVYVEWEEDDSVEAYITTEVLSMRDVKFEGSSATRRDVEYIADEEEGDLYVPGRGDFWYDDDSSYAALYNSDKYDDVPVRMYEFGGDGEDCLTVEFWYDDKGDSKPGREAFISRELDLRTLEVLKV